MLRDQHILDSIYDHFKGTCGTKFSYVSGGLWRCLYAGWRNEMENFASYAKTRFSYRVCMGNCQQFNNHHWRYHRKAPSDKKDDAGWGGFPISFRHNGTLFCLLLIRNRLCISLYPLIPPSLSLCLLAIVILWVVIKWMDHSCNSPVKLSIESWFLEATINLIKVKNIQYEFVYEFIEVMVKCDFTTYDSWLFVMTNIPSTQIIWQFYYWLQKWSVIGKLPYRIKTTLTGFWDGWLYFTSGQRDRGPDNPQPKKVVGETWRTKLHLS